jgi:hypothetical protein
VAWIRRRDNAIAHTMAPMGVSVVSGSNVDLGRRLAPAVAAGGMIGATALLVTHNPSAPGSMYPACVFHQATGLWCPGCGLTRGCYELLHGNIGAALSYNVFTPVAIAVIVGAWLAWIRWAWRGEALRLPPSAARTIAIAMPALLVAYGVLRNIPVGVMRALAP